MAIDAFLKFEGPEVKGESKVKGFVDQIQILDISWSISNPGGGHFGKGSGVGKADFSDFHVIKRFDLASPTLMGFCASGKHFEKATVEFRKVSGDEVPMTWLKIELFDAFITATAPGGLCSGEGTESMAINFDKVQMTYTAQGEKGAKDTTKEFVYSPREVVGGPK